MKAIEEMTEVEKAAFQVAHHRRHRHVGPACAQAFEEALDRLLELTG